MIAARFTYCRSEILAEVHPRVQRGDLIPITVEHQCLALEKLANPPFPGLTPAGVVYLGVHVGIEPVLIRSRDVPGGPWLSIREPDLHNGLPALESVLPW